MLIFAGIIAVGFLADAMARPPIPGTILFMAVVGFGLYGLADGLVYARYGRPDLQDRTDIDPIAIMEESGHRWHWYWGWVRNKRHGQNHATPS